MILITKKEEELVMKNTKKKVLVSALAICLLAIMSFGTLAWFNASDEVTNNFMVAGSEDDDPDEIFSVDVWEDLDGDGVKDEGNGQFENILPGDKLPKVVHVENTGSYDQYIRVKISVTDAAIWQDVYDADMVPVTEFVDIDLDALYGVGSYLEDDNFVYYLYYNDILPVDEEIVVFNKVHIAERLTREQAAALGSGQFDITIKADAVQTANVTPNGIDEDNVYEAFNTVEMVDATNDVNITFVKNYDELNSALTEDGYIVLMDDIEFAPDLKIEKTVNLYLNNHTLYTFNNESPYVHSMNVLGDLTIGGYGKVVLPDLYGIRLDGTLSIYGGTFVDDENREANKQEALINVYANGKLYIYAGTFEGQDYCVYVREEGATVDLGSGVYISKNMVDANKLN